MAIPKSFAGTIENILAGMYMDAVRESDPGAAALLEKRAELQKEPRKTQRLDAYISFWEGLDAAQQMKLAAHDAKLNLVARRARIMSTTEIVRAHNRMGFATAGSIDYVLGRFREEGVAAAQLQKFMDENAVAWFSLTGHPTNPTTVAYTKVERDMARVLADPRAGKEDMMAALRVLRDVPVVGPRKTPLQEAEETLNTLDIIFDSAPDHKKLFEDALEKHGYADRGVGVRTPLARPCAWTLGDGDGNDSMTADVLREGIALHRARIAARYKDADEGDLPYLKSCFGDGFGTIDLRHNAADIVASAARVLDGSGVMDEKRFLSLPAEQQTAALTAWLEDGDATQAMKRAASDIVSARGDRVLERLAVISENPDMCEKLIVAETTHAAQALAALVLLRATGNRTACEGAKVDIVILSESVADLARIGGVVESLLDNKAFRAHAAARGRYLAMIAKSDTTRQDGRGEAEFAQYEAAVDIYRAADRMKNRHPELARVLVSVKNGGGHALQRGGGRVTETPALHGKAAADARVTDMGPSTLTIQGQQQGILFTPGGTALGTLEALAAQNLYSKAGIQGEMPPPIPSKTMNRQYARADACLYAKRAGAAFEAIALENAAVDDLLVNAPWLSMKAGNASSRPARRGEAPVEPGITPRAAKGDNPRALQGRAISGERLTAHACLPVFAVLGLAEAMDAVRREGHARINLEKYGDPLHHLYRAHKIHRDGARATISAAAMADFDIAWPLLAGCPRPSRRKMEDLASRFKLDSGRGGNTPAVTMAFLEEYFLKVEKLTYEMITGHPPKKNFPHGEALRKLWPDLAAQVEDRNKRAEFARVIECRRTRQFDRNPDGPLDETQFRITQALYAAANVIGAPVGILATLTRLEPVHEVGKTGKTRFMRPKSYSEESIAGLLKIPSALGG
ncbi:MAG: phosphoenolpyruvate carboxylase [Proteobacteria bacterium]|nr:phosphoenolpyruvate carboxylase [Pseudomonadota bacterium]